ncbi:MAG: T9SS type A sorting domain-containing protein [Bacteroidales bacterium]|nr:T9SS type A sorting domain-containing protein [Bacteroidales bacterium]
MNNRYIQVFHIIVIALSILCYYQKSNAQTIIQAGEIAGEWTKIGSPYLITGDINISAGKTLNIEAGVTVKFKGLYVLNVQGSLNAIGTATDSIYFTISDSSGYRNDLNIGWNGIHFDPRPVRWDTVRNNQLLHIKNYNSDSYLPDQNKTNENYMLSLSMEGPDLVNDENFPRASIKTKQISKLTFCRFEFATYSKKARPYLFGGIVYIYRYPNLVISNSVFENNRSYAGGAVYCKEATPVIKDNTFRNCTAISSGGAMVFIHSGPILMGNQITNNASGHNGGAVLFYESCPYVLGNIVLNNKARNFGGGFYIEKSTEKVISQGDYTMSDNTKSSRNLSVLVENVDKNTAKNAGNSNGRFHNNLICSNNAREGGGVGIYAAAPELVNNTICDNTADNTGGGFYCFYSTPSLVNTIIYGNGSRQGKGEQMYAVGKNTFLLSYCNLEAGITGIGKDSTCKLSLDYSNIQSNVPLFKDPTHFDYSLQTQSPCINAGYSDTDSLHLASFDLKKQDRIIDNYIDLGAIEYSDSENKLKSANENYETQSEKITANKELVFNVFPNPSTGQFSIVICNNPYRLITVEIFSATGQKVFNQSLTTKENIQESVDLKGYSSGIYVIHLIADNKIICKDEIIIE